MIDRLVAKKQVRRVRHPEDGRSYVLEPTAKGKATNARNGKRFERTIERLRATSTAMRRRSSTPCAASRPPSARPSTVDASTQAARRRARPARARHLQARRQL